MDIQDQIIWEKMTEETEAEILEGGEIERERERVTQPCVLAPDLTSVLQINTFYVFRGINIF